MPPLLFHNVHGDNVRITRDGTVARRVESFCKGIAFSSRPVKVNEKVCTECLEFGSWMFEYVAIVYAFISIINLIKLDLTLIKCI